MQYTIRNIPAEVDQALREQASAEQMSLNFTLIEARSRGLGLGLAKKPESSGTLPTSSARTSWAMRRGWP